MFAIGQLFNRGKNKERIGQILLTNEVLPHFHGIPPISNKTIHVVKKSVDENTVEVFQVGCSSSTTEAVLYFPSRVLTQNKVPVKVKNGRLKPVNVDDSFTKEGFQKGQIYQFKQLGYLGDINDDKKVEMVTDQLVVFKPIGADYFSFYSYQELDALKSCGKLIDV